MFKTFILSFKLRNTYKVNTIIYSIKQLPLINKLLPDALYNSKTLKILGNIISTIWGLISVFFGKLLYVFIMIFNISTIYKTNTPENFLTIFTFLTIIGAYFNTYMFNPTKDKYYAMFIMRMDAKKYTISNYIYAIIKIVIGFLPFTIIFGLLSGISIGACLCMPLLVASAKIIFSAICLKNYEKRKVVINENKPVKYIWFMTAILLLAGYGLPFIGITINEIIFYGISFMAIVLGLVASIYIKKFNLYREMYKKVLTPDNLLVTQQTQKIVIDSVQKQIDVSQEITSTKTGFAYFNDIFIKRHQKILVKSAKKIAFISLFLIIGIIFFTQVNQDIKIKVNEMLMTSLPYFVFVMYLINRGQVITQAMFMNCDHSMLTYSFYRQPKVIVQLFKERIKSIAFINLIPALIIGLGLPIVLYTTGGTDNIYNYVILFISIISMSLFFSVHHLILYYLLQPYNINSETKSSTYTVASTITYFICYYMLKLQLPTIYFGLATIIFAIIYCVISLMIAYKLAPNTFKIRT